MVGLINFHFSNGMLSLFIDQDIGNKKTFRTGFVTHQDAWNVSRVPKEELFKLKIKLLKFLVFEPNSIRWTSF